MNIAGIKAVFIVGRVSKETIAISARSRKEINVQIIMEQLWWVEVIFQWLLVKSRKII